MPKLKGRIIKDAKNITRVTWKTRDTARGVKSRLVNLKLDQPPSTPPGRASGINQSTPRHKDIGQTSAGFTGEAADGYDDFLRQGMSKIPRLRLPKKSQYQYLREWVDHSERYLRTLQDMESPPNPRTCRRCGGDGVYRCRNCFGSPLFCTRCCRDEHLNLPFHRIEQWTGTFFAESSLHLAGLLIHLGHGGRKCPRTAGTPAGDSDSSNDIEDEWIDCDRPAHLQKPSGRSNFTVVDVSGFHYIEIHYCSCPDSDPYDIQLLRHRLFPASIKNPKTVFTFDVLDDFVRDNVECGTSASNYHNKLRRVTSNVFPHLTADRYPQLLRVSRKWRFLKLLKWRGFGYETQTQAPSSGDLVLFCPTCPQLGVNVQASSDADLNDWKYARTIFLDGNFKADHLHDRRPDKQVWLMDGRGYQVSREPYQKYLASASNSIEKSECNNHRAVNHANTNRGNFESTGIGAAACACHGCFVPHSVVNFQKGERYSNMDYCFTNALRHNMEGIKRVISFYDINCAYMKKFRARVNGSAALHTLRDLAIVPGIGIWHVHGHKASCFPRYAPLYIDGAGWIDGEIIETLWSILNVVSPSTRGMVAPGRQEMLDFQMNDSNFQKMIRMSNSLAAKLETAIPAALSAQQVFERLDAAISSTNRAEWEEERRLAMARRLTDPSAMDIFQMRGRDAPTVREKEIELLDLAAQSPDNVAGSTTWLARGLQVEESAMNLLKDMRMLKKQGTDGQRLTIVRRVEKLSTELERFISEAPIYLGDTLAEDDCHDGEHRANSSDFSDDDEEEDMPDIAVPFKGFPELPLPSKFGHNICSERNIGHLAEQEFQLRIGQANDALHAIRLALAEKAILFRTDIRHAGSYATTTRAWAKVSKVDATLQRHAGVYRKCRLAMMSLRPTADQLSEYQPLASEDLKVTTAISNPDGSGHRNANLAWFWTAQIPQDEGNRDWMSEFYRVNWHRANAARDRWTEEVEILTAEFGWTRTFFETETSKWLERQKHAASRNLFGHAAYAARHAAMFSQLKVQCDEKGQGKHM